MLNLCQTSILHYSQREAGTLVLCLVLVFNLACSQPYGKNYFPLKDGAKWEYIGSFPSASGKQISVRATIKIDGETLINGKRYYKFVTSSDFSGAPEINRSVEDVRYYRVAENGIYVRPGVDPDKQDLLEMPLPIPTGTKWISGATEVQAERAGTIIIEGHEYKDCLKFTFRLADGVRSTEQYLAPNVGIVKMIYVNNTEPKSVIELTLKKYVP